MVPSWPYVNSNTCLIEFTLQYKDINMVFFKDVLSCFQSFFFVLRDEGVVLKDLGSKWEPGDRSGKWLKLKPEYIRAGADLDVLIIGLYLILCYFSLFKTDGHFRWILLGILHLCQEDTMAPDVVEER